MSTQKFPVYLYVKTHLVTGLKYFGRTIKSDVSKYKGSGKYWRRHIKEHGYNVSTEIVGVFYNEEDLNNFAVSFSLENNIVESEQWANLIVEDGFGGGFTPWDSTRKEKYKSTVKGRMWFNNGKEQRLSKCCPEGYTPGRLPSPRKGKTSSLKGTCMSEEDKEKRRKPKRNKEKYSYPKPQGVKDKLSKKRWWKNTDTNECVFQETCPPGFTKGRLILSIH